MKRVIPILFVVGLSLPAACSESDRVAPVAAPTDEVARDAIDAAGSPQGGSGSGVSFKIGRRIDGVPAEQLGRLASSSWDVYFVLDDGTTGAWGAGLDVFDDAATAQEAARKNATFLACRGERRPIAGFAFDDPEYGAATSCPRAGGPGFIATASESDGTVTANLTVVTDDRVLGEEALGEVWASIEQTAARVRTNLAG